MIHVVFIHNYSACYLLVMFTHCMQITHYSLCSSYIYPACFFLVDRYRDWALPVSSYHYPTWSPSQQGIPNLRSQVDRSQNRKTGIAWYVKKNGARCKERLYVLKWMWSFIIIYYSNCIYLVKYTFNIV